jgi:hypothetical protein
MSAALFSDIALCSPDVNSTLKIEVIQSPETPILIHTTRDYIPEDGNIHNYGCENLICCT